MDDDFRAIRCYGRAEAAKMLKVKEYRLKRWVTARSVPHQRSGLERGVWFTYEDLQWIGQHLHELMPLHRASSAGGGAAPSELRADGDGVSDEDLLQHFGGLRSLRTGTN